MWYNIVNINILYYIVIKINRKDCASIMKTQFDERFTKSLNKEGISIIISRDKIYSYNTSELIQTEKMVTKIFGLENRQEKFIVVFDKTYWQEDREFSYSQYVDFKYSLYPFVIKGVPGWKEILSKITELKDFNSIYSLAKNDGVYQYNQLLKRTFDVIKSQTCILIEECNDNVGIQNFLEDYLNSEAVMEDAWQGVLENKEM